MSTDAFDIKTVLLAKHAQHVVLIHFPIALFATAVGLDFVWQWTKSEGMAAAAYFNFLLAAISSVPVVASGIGAWQWALEGQRLKGILMMHLVLGCTSAVLMWIVFWMHSQSRRHLAYTLPRFRLFVEALAVASVMVTGHVGGFLSGVNG
ncbi:MAG TPA: DUF2231 domain-containing protein [Terriglobales bacterium]|nr:DUF2231 domain-containing protein [Terriglobales bacterium]